MKNFTHSLVVLILALLASGCGGAAQPASQSTPDVQATVDAGVQATAAAQAAMQATIDASVQATAQAIGTPAPTVEYVTMTEEELAALIDEAVAEAIAASSETTQATTQATSDNTVTAEEVEYIYGYYYPAYEDLYYALELIYAYEEYYGELAEETLELIYAFEDDLLLMAESLEAINTTLIAINSSLEQGLALAEETITQLNTAAQAMQTQAGEIQAQAQTWYTSLQTELEARTQKYLGMQPQEIAADRTAALQSAFDYIDTVRLSLQDKKLSKEELANISQLGANAFASLQAQGGPQLEQFSGKISEIIGMLARGQVPTAQFSLGEFEKSLPQRPARP